MPVRARNASRWPLSSECPRDILCRNVLASFGIAIFASRSDWLEFALAL